MTVLDADTVSFVHARPRLFGIARRVLGSAADADDVVQEAWIRWQESDRSDVRDPAAFLATTTTRLALNVGQSARVRRETDFGERVVELVDPAADPVLDAEQREAVSRALWTLLETLSPTERAVYVLREAFDYPHRRIAKTLGLGEANARQLVTRARRHIAGAPRWAVDIAEHEELVDAFVAAAQTGDLARLEDLLVGEGSDARIAA
jgi:RNA polymerase sigma-70 factor (ECF subfamily)